MDFFKTSAAILRRLHFSLSKILNKNAQLKKEKHL